MGECVDACVRRKSVARFDRAKGNGEKMTLRSSQGPDSMVIWSDLFRF